MLRIASIPSGHPYVERLLPGATDGGYPAVPRTNRAVARPGGPVRLPDPVPRGARADEGRWWPPRMLEPEWLRAHAGLAHVVHAHFGFEGRTIEQLAEWVGAVRELGLPLVVTAHDLDNPHLRDQTHHWRALGVLLPAADAVLTLTPGAARRLTRCWGVEAAVVPHPQVLDDDDILDDGVGATDVPVDAGALGAPDAGAGAPRLGIHLGALRANVRVDPWLEPLVAAAARSGTRVEVLVNDEVPQGHPVLSRARAVCDGTQAASVRAVPRLSDAQLHGWIRSLDVAALPYGHGSHSGWLEMCWDAGVSVLLPQVGHYAEQHPDPAFCASLAPERVADSLDGLLSARRDGCPWGDGTRRLTERRRLLAHVREVHAATYARVAGRR